MPFLNARKWPGETSVPSSVTKPSTDDGTEVNSDDDLKPGSSIWKFDEQPKDGVSPDCSLTESKQDEANVAGNAAQVVVQDSALMVLSSQKTRTGDIVSNALVESMSSTNSYEPDSVNPGETRVDSSSSWCAAEPKMQVPVRNQRERLRHSHGDLTEWMEEQPVPDCQSQLHEGARSAAGQSKDQLQLARCASREMVASPHWNVQGAPEKSLCSAYSDNLEMERKSQETHSPEQPISSGSASITVTLGSSEEEEELKICTRSGGNEVMREKVRDEMAGTCLCADLGGMAVREVQASCAHGGAEAISDCDQKVPVAAMCLSGQDPPCMLYCGVQYNASQCESSTECSAHSAEEGSALLLLTSEGKQEELLSIGLNTCAAQTADISPRNDRDEQKDMCLPHVIPAQQLDSDQQSSPRELDITTPKTDLPEHANKPLSYSSHVFVQNVRAVSIKAPIQISGRPISAIIDTGAEVTVLSHKVFEQIPSTDKPEIRKTGRSLVVAEDGKQMDSPGVAEICFQIHDSMYKWPMYIAPIGDEMLLGADFLHHYGANVDFRHGMNLEGHWIDCRIERHAGEVNRVLMSESVTIPSGHEMVILASSTGPMQGVGIFEPSATPDESVLCARVLVAAENPYILLRCLNQTSEPICLRQGAELGTIEEVDDILFTLEEPGNPRPCSHSSVPEVLEEALAVNAVYLESTEPLVLPPEEEANLNDSITVQSDQEESQETEEVVSLPEHLVELYTKSSCKIDDQVARRNLADLLCKHREVFAKTKTELGVCKVVKHKINTSFAAPVRQPMRPVPKGFEKEELSHLQEQIQAGVVVPSKSPWASPVVLVRKKDGSVRWCVDFRRVNELSVKDAYPLPRIDMCLDCLAEAKLFSTLDLQSGYWQLKMDEHDQEKTSFITKYGLYEYTVMPFGLASTPSTFQRAMELIFRGVQWQTLVIYLDDLIIFSPLDYTEHFQRLDEVLTRLHEAGLKLKPSKCELLQPEVLFLGHIVGQNGVQTNPELITKVRDWKEPTNVRQVQQFLGLCNYYRRFIHKFSDIVQPIVQLTRKDVPFNWTAICQRSFEALKTALCSAPMLSLPKPQGQYILDTDASAFAIGAVLSQIQDGEEKVLEYASRTLTPQQQRYCTTRRELLAVVTFLKQFRHYILSQSLIVRTDHSSLRWLCNFKDPQGQLACWLEVIQEYQITIEHRPGKKHGNADAMSRLSSPCAAELPCGNCQYCRKCTEEWAHFDNEEDVAPLSLSISKCRAVTTRAGRGTLHSSVSAGPTQGNWLSNHSIRELEQLQREDPDLGILHAWLDEGLKPEVNQVSKHGPAVRFYFLHFESLVRQHGVLYLTRYEQDMGSGVLKLLVPKTLRTQVLQFSRHHVFGAHFGVTKTLGRVQRRYTWYGLTKDVKQHISCCKVCGENLRQRPRFRAPLGDYRVGYPMDRLGVDILGPLPLSEKQNKYILVLGDYFTRWMEAFPLPDQRVETVAHALVHRFVAIFGCPLEIHTDQGKNFESDLFQEVCRLLQVKKSRTTPYHPSSNGLVERFNQTLAKMIRSFVDRNHKQWDMYLPLLTAAYRSTVHPGTGFTPNMMMFGREVNLPLDVLYPMPQREQGISDYVQQLRENLEIVYRYARENLGKASQRQKRDYDLQIHAQQYVPGDLVYRQNPRGKKLEHLWIGPLVVTKRYNASLYQVANRKKSCVLHHDLLRPYTASLVPNWAQALCRNCQKAN